MEKNLKKLFSSLLTAVLLVGVGSSAIKAEEQPLKAKTDIHIEVEEGTIIDPEEGGGGEENPGGTKGQLSIWLKPKKMDFKGEYDEVQDYTLDLVDADETSRRLAIADIRSKETGWALNASVKDLRSEDTGNTIEAGNYKLHLKENKVGTYEIKDNKVGAVDFENDNDVAMSDVLTVTNEATVIATASNKLGSGKGYTALDFEKISLEIDAGKGEAGSYTGEVVWDLSSTAN